MDDAQEDLRALGEISAAAFNFFAVSRGEQFTLIREMYAAALPMIRRAAAKGRGVDPYFVDWTRYFTPIEMDGWQCLRYHGVPMYPQFPALDYFIDFADPIRKIGLELDGKNWHDKAKDRIRDTRLFNEEGWRIFRVSGSEAHADRPSPSELEARGYEGHVLTGRTIEWVMQSVDGVVAAIQYVFYRRPGQAVMHGADYTLHVHRLADFPIIGSSGD